MQRVKLKDGTEFNILYCEPGEILGGGEKTLEIGVVLNRYYTPLDVENAFKANAGRIEVGDTGLAADGKTEIPIETSRVFEGYTQIKTYTVDRSFTYDENKQVELMRVILQEPSAVEMLRQLQAAVVNSI